MKMVIFNFSQAYNPPSKTSKLAYPYTHLRPNSSSSLSNSVIMIDNSVSKNWDKFYFVILNLSLRSGWKSEKNCLSLSWEMLQWKV